MLRTDEREAQATVIGLFRQVAEELSNINCALRHTREAMEKQRDGTASSSEVTHESRRTRDLVERSRVPIDTFLDEMNEILERDGFIRDWCGREVTHLVNTWESLQYEFGNGGDLSPKPKSLATVKEWNDRLTTATLEIAYVTVPTRLAGHLDSYSNGQILDFHAEFEDEYPGRRERQQILEYLHDHPNCVPGIVDVASGEVTCVSKHGWRRAMSLIVTILLALVAVGGAYALGHWDETPGLHSTFSEQPDDFGRGMLLVFVGQLGHVLVGAIKQVRSAANDDARRFTSLGNWIVWINAKEVMVWSSVVIAAAVGYFLVGVKGETNVLTALATGYSADSLWEILFPKFERGVAGRTEKVAQAVK